MKTSLVLVTSIAYAFGPIASAVTVATSQNGGSTTVSSTTATAPAAQQPLPNSGSINAVANALTATDLGGGSWEFNGLSFASIAASRGGSGANSDVVASAQVAYQIAFNLGLGESATVSLDLGYSLSEVGLNGTLGWNFSGPTGSIAEISGSVGSAATNQNLLNQTITTQQVFISAPGTYTFNLTGSMPSQTTNKSESVSVVLNSIDFQITAIPEPGVRAIAALGLGMLVARRRRIRA